MRHRATTRAGDASADAALHRPIQVFPHGLYTEVIVAAADMTGCETPSTSSIVPAASGAKCEPSAAAATDAPCTATSPACSVASRTSHSPKRMAVAGTATVSTSFVTTQV